MPRSVRITFENEQNQLVFSPFFAELYERTLRLNYKPLCADGIHIRQWLDGVNRVSFHRIFPNFAVTNERDRTRSHQPNVREQASKKNCYHFDMVHNMSASVCAFLLVMEYMYMNNVAYIAW